MTLARSVAEILDQHSRLCLSSIDRLYLSVLTNPEGFSLAISAGRSASARGVR
jgi:hypothetical protein